ncbi:MAG: helix-turn-helix domain-containing protein [Armatimonadota bacterium]|nr:helix-turn-helix domain-containing protein [Armatimonadota bacterium]MDR7567964.1 helix-turn-helix domain-containing protein [Armatimonadota bacterium]
MTRRLVRRGMGFRGVHIPEGWYVTLSQAAELLGLSPGTLSNRVRAGVLRVLNVSPPGRKAVYLVSVEEVERYRREHLGRFGPRPRGGKERAGRRGRSRPCRDSSAGRASTCGRWRSARGSDPRTGRRVRVWRTVKGTRKEAERLLARLLHEAAQGAMVDPGRCTVEEWLRAWLDLKRPAVFVKTYERYEEVVRLHVVPALGRIPLHRLHPHHVQRLYADLLGAGKHPRTVLHVHRVLHTALEAGVKQQVVGRNVCDAVEPPRVPVQELRVPSEEEVFSLLDASRGTRLYLPVLLGTLCGLRRGEVLALRWETWTSSGECCRYGGAWWRPGRGGGEGAQEWAGQGRGHPPARRGRPLQHPAGLPVGARLPLDERFVLVPQ